MEAGAADTGGLATGDGVGGLAFDRLPSASHKLLRNG
ncbi:hypothetical protein IFHNHDMJ_01735 [Synechococcus sp. CBW1107]|jgi:hypothetical protein|nr:hypothetical protein IFHNHDMJ_01735 [Synechococcus sp. CBW1107]